MRIEERWMQVFIKNEKEYFETQLRFKIYEDTLKKIEQQKKAEKLRLDREKMLRKQRSIKESSPEKIEIQTKVSESNLDDSPDIGPETLSMESKLIKSVSLTCGSYFCFHCYRMLKRSSLFLKCSECCDKAFLESIPSPSPAEVKRIPENSLCVACNNPIVKGEIVQCICCYIRNDFLRNHLDTQCGGCANDECVNWVDTYLGQKFELVKCGFCERNCNYAYIFEVCSACHDQICLHCLRKNPFVASAICSECNNRREFNPSKKRTRSNKL